MTGKPFGYYFVFAGDAVEGLPNNDPTWWFLWYVPSGIWAFPHNTNKVWRAEFTNNYLYEWREVAFGDPPQVYDLPLTDGFSAWGLCHYWKGQNGIVTLNVNISSTPATTAGNEAVIGNLPEGFRPTGHVIAAAYCNHGNDLNSKPGYIFVDYLGAVRMRGDADWTLGHASVTFFAP